MQNQGHFWPHSAQRLVISHYRYFMYSLIISHVPSLEDALHQDGMRLLTTSKDEYFKFLYIQEKWIFSDSYQMYATSGQKDEISNSKPFKPLLG